MRMDRAEPYQLDPSGDAALRMAKRIRRRVLRVEGEDRLHDEAERQFGLPASSLAYSATLPAPLYEPARVASN
jgi:hypothetical protein